MRHPELSPQTLDALRTAQRNELTEHGIYTRLAARMRDPANARVLERLAEAELGHHRFWQSFTGLEVKPSRWKSFWFYWISRLFGLTFGLKLMERGEERAQVTYGRIARDIPEAGRIVEDEDRHEAELLAMLDEDLLRYVGSIVLGLNDALVELTGVLAGLTFAMRNTRLIALAGLITGIAAAFSMAASEYLSQKSDAGTNPLRASIYTGITYIFTVMLLILPYLLFPDYLFCLAVTLVLAILVILVFNYYISVARDLPFRRRFLEMAAISLGVAAVTFGIGYLIRIFLGIQI